MANKTVKEIVSSFESAQFTTVNDMRTGITVSNESVTEVFKNLGDSIRNWHTARVGKRPAMSADYIGKIRNWSFLFRRQVNRTYGDSTWIKTKLDKTKTEIDMSDYADVFVGGTSGKVHTFVELDNIIANVDKIMDELYTSIITYIDTVERNVVFKLTFDSTNESARKLINTIGTPEALIDRYVDALGDLPLGRKITKEVANGTVRYIVAESGKKVPESMVLPALDEIKFKQFAQSTNKILSALADNNSLLDWGYIDLNDYAPENANSRRLRDRALQNAIRARDVVAQQALDYTFWNTVLTEFGHQLSLIILEVAKAHMDYMNRHLVADVKLR